MFDVGVAVGSSGKRVGISLYIKTGGGAFAHTLALARGLDPARFEVELLARPIAPEEPGRAKVRAAGLRLVEVEDHEQLSAHLLARRPDIVQHFDSLMVLFALELVHEELGEQRPRSVQLLHANGRPSIPLDEADLVVGVSPSTLRWPGAEELGARARVIFNGVPRTPAIDRSSARAAPTILVLSRLVEGKAIDEGLRSLAELEALPWSLRVVGDGPARPELEGLAAQLGIGARVSFVGAVDDPRAELERADLMLSTSPSEGFGLALAEAAEAGLALVTRRAGGLSEALEHGRHALLYSRADELGEQLSAALTRVELRAELGANARAWMHERFDLDRMIAAYSALYEGLVSDRGDG